MSETVYCPSCKSKEVKIFETKGSFGSIIAVLCACGWGNLFCKNRRRDDRSE